MQVVFGVVTQCADILIGGEGPGEYEDKYGLPFYGRAGEILNEFLGSVALDREKDFYITNVVCCRPTADVLDDRTGETRTDNRQPSKVEREACRPRLLETIYLVDPLLIVTVGKVPFQALTGKASEMKAVRGRMRTLILQGREVPIPYPILPIYHTAFLARSSDRRKEGPWGKTLEDFVRMVKILDHLRLCYHGIKKPDRKEMLSAKRSTRTKRG
jgi:DNA polymerase